MYCRLCGSEIEEDAQFCPVCGAQISQEPEGEENEENEGEGETTILRAEPQQQYTPIGQAGQNAEYMPAGQAGQNAEYTPAGRAGQNVEYMQADASFSAPMEEYNAEYEDMHLEEEADEVKKTPMQHKKLVRSCVIAVIALCIVMAGAFCCYYFTQGRSKGKTIEKFEQALNNNNKEDMLGLMFPKEQRESGRSTFRDGKVDLLTWSYDRKEKDGAITLELNDSTDVDEKDAALREDIEEILLNEVGVSYDEMVVAELDVTCSKKEDSAWSEVVMYRAGNKWYILPGCLQAVTEDRQKSDIDQAAEIQKAINTSLSDSAVAQDMQGYHNLSISLQEDLSYLPQSFIDAYNQNMGELQAFRYTETGASGYSFSIDDRGNVSVYIASARHIDEWEVVPDVADAYYDGTIREGEDGDRALAYVRLISEKSPILGYWQSDRAGMYIGYNASGGQEGFTIYLAFQQYSDEIVNALTGFQCSGDNGYILYTYNGANGRDYKTEYKLIVNSDSSITLEVSNIIDNATISLKNDTLEFTKGEIDKNKKMTFAGTWIDEGMIGHDYMGTFGDKKEIILCDTCGYVHAYEAENEAREDDVDFHNDAVVELYDGKTLKYIFPIQGLAVDDSGQKRLSYQCVYYTLTEDDQLVCASYITNGGSDACLYAKNDSKKGAAIEATAAYEEFVSKDGNIPQLMAIGPYSLVYLDGDDTPEMITSSRDEEAMGAIFTYRDGKVTYKELEWSNYDNDLVYYERGGKYWYSTYKDDISVLHGGELKNGSCTEYHVASCDESILDEPQFYVGDNLSSQQDYENAWNNAYDREKAKAVYYYNSIEEAYDALGF